MTESIPSFAEYVASLGRLTPHIDPTLISPETEQIRAAAESLTGLAEVSRESLAAWALGRLCRTPGSSSTTSARVALPCLVDGDTHPAEPVPRQAS
ncbi:MAG: hypothetical protein ACRDTG_03120 [Pseudonocardiaceae bacterium]